MSGSIKLTVAVWMSGSIKLTVAVWMSGSIKLTVAVWMPVKQRKAIGGGERTTLHVLQCRTDTCYSAELTRVTVQN